MPTDPMLNIARSVELASDQLIAMELADPNRMGLIGHTFGRIGVLSVASQSNSFRAVVAHSGPTNFTSMYGPTMPHTRWHTKI